jgi:hypothetical protein
VTTTFYLFSIPRPEKGHLFWHGTYLGKCPPGARNWGS